MREIKFRAWRNGSKMYQKMAPTMNIHTGEISDLPRRFILEQFTGLRDKNGNEIYEGDIVKFDDMWGDFPQPVIFQCGCSGMINGAETFLDMNYLYNVKVELAVIGNIHENPELLK